MFNTEIKKTSADWQEIIPEPLVLDPDGWDRQNFQHSWYEEQITRKEYFNRLSSSTVTHSKRWIEAHQQALAKYNKK